MKARKSDLVLAREAKQKGLMVSMINILPSITTELNRNLMKYFREQLPAYEGIFDEDDGESILSDINDYLQENNIDKMPLHFPMTSGTDNHLIPINENIKLLVQVTDEYYGDGDYSKYVAVTSFIINEQTTKEDVDILVNFVKKYIL